MIGYHALTAYQRHSLSGHGLDFGNQPSPFKEYLNHKPFPLPKARPPKTPLKDLIFEWPLNSTPKTQQEPDSAILAAILLMTQGITQDQGLGAHMGGLRAAASAGALYPCEIYVVACDVEGIENGLYHFTPKDPGLHLLWSGRLAEKASAITGLPPKRLTFFISAMFWRSMWKYGSRAYRYCLLDTGHMLANLELALASFGLETQTNLDFVDLSSGVFLGLATEDEVCLATVAAGGPCIDPGPENPGLPPFDRAARPLSPKMSRDSLILETYAQGNLEKASSQGSVTEADSLAKGIACPPPVEPDVDLLEVIRKRRSRRNFLGTPLGKKVVCTLLQGALPGFGPIKNRVLIAFGENGSGGKHTYHPGSKLLETMDNQIDARWALGQACLGQAWLGKASCSLVLFADLTKLQEQIGPRGYRHAMIASGHAGQRLYLIAQALNLGCCGVGAFYDDEVAKIARLKPTEQPLYVLGCGDVKGLKA